MAAASQRALLFVPLVVCACRTTRAVPLAPEVVRELPERSAIVLEGGERVQLAEAHVTADSLVGTRRDGRRIAVSRDRVAFIEERRVSGARTLGLIGALTFGAFVALVALATAAGPGLP